MSVAPLNVPEDGLRALLRLRQIDENLFEGGMTDEPWPRVYGGQVLGQAVAATGETVDAAKRLHSLHAYFLKPGNPVLPTRFRVETLRDGTSFSVRRVAGYQEDQCIFELTASYHRPEQGYAHTIAMPVVAPPEKLDPDRSNVFALLGDLPRAMGEPGDFLKGIDYRLAFEHADDASPGRAIWFRVTAPISDAARDQEAALVYASDFTLAGSIMLAHRQSASWRGIFGGSLDHALWLHADFRIDDWLLYVQSGPWAANARGLGMGHIFSRAGALVASVAQEALIRPAK